MLIFLFRAQTEQAIGQSYPTGSAKNHRNPDEDKSQLGVGMTIDKDCGDPDTYSQEQAKYSVRSSDVEESAHDKAGGLRGF